MLASFGGGGGGGASGKKATTTTKEEPKHVDDKTRSEEDAGGSEPTTEAAPVRKKQPGESSTGSGRATKKSENSKEFSPKTVDADREKFLKEVDSSDPAERAKETAFVEWLVSSRAKFSECVELRAYDAEVRGVHAARPISPDEIIMEIPLRCLITVEMGKATDVGRAVLAADLELDAPKHVFLMLFLLTDRARGEARVLRVTLRKKVLYSSYLLRRRGVSVRALLRHVAQDALEHARVLVERRIEALGGLVPLAANRRAQTRHRVRLRRHLRVLPGLLDCGDVEGLRVGAHVRLLEKLWRRRRRGTTTTTKRQSPYLVNTLAIVLYVKSSDEEEEEDSRVTSPQVRTSALVPYADMLNHLRPRETKWTYDNSRHAFTITALRPISKGEQIYDSYGQKCNHRFLLNYGFAVEKNVEPDGFCPNEVALSLSLRVDTDPLAPRKQLLWIRDGNAGPKRVRVCAADNENFRAALSLLRVIVADDDDLERLLGRNPYGSFRTASDVHFPVSLKNEVRALRALGDVCDDMLKAYPTSLSDDVERLARNPDRDPRGLKAFSNARHAVVHVKSEKTVLHHYVDFVDIALSLAKIPLFPQNNNYSTTTTTSKGPGAASGSERGSSAASSNNNAFDRALADLFDHPTEDRRHVAAYCNSVLRQAKRAALGGQRGGSGVSAAASASPVSSSSSSAGAAFKFNNDASSNNASGDEALLDAANAIYVRAARDRRGAALGAAATAGTKPARDVAGGPASEAETDTELDAAGPAHRAAAASNVVKPLLGLDEAVDLILATDPSAASTPAGQNGAPRPQVATGLSGDDRDDTLGPIDLKAPTIV